MSANVLFPLIRLPESWPVPFAATLAMVCLAALDLPGAVALRRRASRRQVGGDRVVLAAQAYLVIAPSASSAENADPSVALVSAVTYELTPVDAPR